MASDALPEWAEGVLVCLFGSTLTALGLVLQKHAHIVLAEAAGGTAKPGRYFCQRWWLLGFTCYLSAQVINMTAMAMTPQVVLSCLGSWTLVCNTLFARIILRESVSLPQRVAVAGLVVATALVVYSAPRPPPNGENAKVSAGELPQRFGSLEFEAATALLLGVALLTRLVAEGVVRSSPDRAQRLLATAWTVAAAVSTGYTALFFKCIAEILATCHTSATFVADELSLWQTWAVVGLAFSCAPLELHCLNTALRLGEASLVVPMYLALGMLAQLCTGGVFFGEFRWFHSRLDVASFASSVAVMLTCVVSMAVLQVRDADDVDAEGETARSPPVPRRKATPGASPPSANGPRFEFVPSVREPLVRSPEQSGKWGKRVSVAGFGAAIECSEGTHQLPRRHTVSAVLDQRPDLEALDLAAKSPSDGPALDRSAARTGASLRSAPPDLHSSLTSGVAVTRKAQST